MLQLAFYLLVSFLASVAGAICGIGGGVIIKPVLDVCGLASVSTISFLSGCTVLAMAAASLLKSRGNGVKLPIKTTTPLAVGAAAGGLLGKELFQLVQSGLLLLTTALVWLYTRKKDQLPSYRLKGLPVCALAGLVLGVASAFLGIGGGPLNVAMLFLFFSMDARQAAKNSIFIILFSQSASLASALCQQNVPPFSWLHLLLMSAGGIGGALLGAAFSKKMDNKAVERLLLGLMLVIIGINLYNTAVFAAAVWG